MHCLYINISTLIVIYFIAVGFKEILMSVPEDGEKITPKHAGAI